MSDITDCIRVAETLLGGRLEVRLIRVDTSRRSIVSPRWACEIKFGDEPTYYSGDVSGATGEVEAFIRTLRKRAEALAPELEEEEDDDGDGPGVVDKTSLSPLMRRIGFSRASFSDEVTRKLSQGARTGVLAIVAEPNARNLDTVEVWVR